MNSGQKILLTAIISEVALAFAWWLAWYLEYIPDLKHTLRLSTSLGYVCIYLLTLTALNCLLFYTFPVKKSQDFIKNFVNPLCSNLTIRQAFMVSIFAGIGEELFFRSFLLVLFQNIIGWSLALITTSILFAYLHFFSKAKEYFQIFLVYCFVGFIFGFIRYQTNSDYIPMAVHAIYDFIAILFIKHSLQNKLSD